MLNACSIFSGLKFVSSQGGGEGGLCCKSESGWQVHTEETAYIDGKYGIYKCDLTMVPINTELFLRGL